MDIVHLIIDIVLCVATVLSTWSAIHYKRKELSSKVSKTTIKINKKLIVYMTRDEMLTELHSLYEKAEQGDIIWGQSVSGNIYGDVSGKIAEAAARGVHFEMFFSSDTIAHDSPKKQLCELFNNLKNAMIRHRSDNNIRIQGLSEKSIVIALPEGRTYAAVLITDTDVTKVWREWFVNRLNQSEDIEIR